MEPKEAGLGEIKRRSGETSMADSDGAVRISLSNFGILD